MSTQITRRSALRAFAAGTAGLALPSVLAACGSGGGSGGSSDGPIKIGVLTDLTGSLGTVGRNNEAIARFTIDEINAAGGVLGRRLEMVLVDSASDPATGARVASQLIRQDEVDMVIGGVTSATREAIKSVIDERGRTIFVWPASYEGGECGERTWSVGAVPNQQVDPIVRHLLDGGARTFYLCGNDYSYPRSVLEQVRARVEAAGAEVVGEEYVPLATTDTSNLQSKILASRADALFEIIVLPQTAPFIRGVVEGGFRGVIASTLFDEGITPLFGRDAQGLISAQDFFLTIDDPGSRRVVDAFKARYPREPFCATFNTPAWYRGLHLWALAAEEAGSTDADAINEAIDSVSSDRLVGGPAGFAPGTQHCNLSIYLGEMQGDGSVRVLESLRDVAPTGQCDA